MWSSFFLAFFLSHLARASPTEATCRPSVRPISVLAGLVDVEWMLKRREYRFEAAVRVDSPQKASFQAIDDFGNTFFTIHFEGERGDRVPAIPLSRSDVVTYLLHRHPESMKNVECRYDKRGRLLSVEKKSKKKKEAHLVLFSDFRKKGKFSYPHRIEIVAKKGNVKMMWKQLERIY